jgi:hypothetical protein
MGEASNSPEKNPIMSWVKALQQNAIAAILVATLTMGFDFLFHWYETDPMEVPAYFVAKFALALVVAIFLPLAPKLKQYLTFSFAYTVLFTGLYYGLGLYVLNVPGLSVWSPSNYVQFTLFGSPVSLAEFATVEFFVHMLVFLAAAVIIHESWKRLRG